METFKGNLGRRLFCCCALFPVMLRPCRTRRKERTCALNVKEAAVLNLNWTLWFHRRRFAVAVFVMRRIQTKKASLHSVYYLLILPSTLFKALFCKATECVQVLKTQFRPGQKQEAIVASPLKLRNSDRSSVASTASNSSINAGIGFKY